MASGDLLTFAWVGFFICVLLAIIIHNEYSMIFGFLAFVCLFLVSAANDPVVGGGIFDDWIVYSTATPSPGDARPEGTIVSEEPHINNPPSEPPTVARVFATQTPIDTTASISVPPTPTVSATPTTPEASTTSPASINPPSTPSPASPPTPTPAPGLAAHTKEKGYCYVVFGSSPAGGAKLVWRVLEVKPNAVLLLSDAIVANHKWNSVEEGGWWNCTLRAWLNGEFCTECLMALKPFASALLPLPSGDLVTLPTQDDLKKLDYGFGRDTNKNRAAIPLTRAESGDTGKAEPYFTRPVVSGTKLVYAVNAQGEFEKVNKTRPDIGVRPMICLSLDVLEIYKGDGTAEDPFTFQLRSTATPTP